MGERNERAAAGLRGRQKKESDMADPRQARKSEDAPALHILLRRIEERETPSPARERELARKARRGNRRAADLLVGANQRHVVRFARRYRDRGLALMDLIAEGTVGLLCAVRTYDERRHARFATHALHTARERIREAVRA
jgi:RNA polymerase primary sigma factor